MGLRNVTDVSMKIDTVVRCGWTTQPCAQKLNTAWQVQVAGSTVSVTLDVAGAKIVTGLWICRGPNSDLGLGELGLDLGCT